MPVLPAPVVLRMRRLLEHPLQVAAVVVAGVVDEVAAQLQHPRVSIRRRSSAAGPRRSSVQERAVVRGGWVRKDCRS